MRLSVERNLWVGSPVTFSPDGSLIAASLHETFKGPGWQRVEPRGVQVWELATLLPVVRLKTGEVAHLQFTPQGHRLIAAGRDALILWDLASGRAVARRPSPGRFLGSFGESFASCLTLAPDGHTTATGQPDTTVLLWDLAPPAALQTPSPLTNADQEACWDDLAGADAGRALRAIDRLASQPGQAVTLLRERLRPAQAPPGKTLRRLIAELDHDRFATREAAVKRLGQLSELAEGALLEAQRGSPTPEARRRIEGLLAGPRLVLDREARRHLRAVRLLELIGSPTSREVLQSLAGGAPKRGCRKRRRRLWNGWPGGQRQLRPNISWKSGIVSRAVSPKIDFLCQTGCLSRFSMPLPFSPKPSQSSSCRSSYASLSSSDNFSAKSCRLLITIVGGSTFLRECP